MCSAGRQYGIFQRRARALSCPWSIFRFQRDAVQSVQSTLSRERIALTCLLLEVKFLWATQKVPSLQMAGNQGLHEVLQLPCDPWEWFGMFVVRRNGEGKTSLALIQFLRELNVMEPRHPQKFYYILRVGAGRGEGFCGAVVVKFAQSTTGLQA